MKKLTVKISAVLLIMTISLGLFATGCSKYEISIKPRGDKEEEEEEKTEKEEPDDKEPDRTYSLDGLFPGGETKAGDKDKSGDKDKDKPKETEEPEDPEDTEGPDETEEPETTTTAAPQESGGTTTAKPTSKPIGKTKVTNAYKKTFKTKYLGKVTSTIPKVTIAGVNTNAINKEMYNALKNKYKKCKVTYSKHIGGTYVSIFVSIIPDTDWEDSSHLIYNISRRTGKKMSRSEMCKALNMTTSKFEARAKKAIKKYWISGKFNTMDKKAYNKAISKSTLNKAIPWVNGKGKLCYFVADMKIPVDAGVYDNYGTC